MAISMTVIDKQVLSNRQTKGLYYKTLKIRNLWKIGRFRINLLSFFIVGNTYTRMDRHQLTVESVYYKPAMFL
jgi:hypothetical protein